MQMKLKVTKPKSVQASFTPSQSEMDRGYSIVAEPTRDNAVIIMESMHRTEDDTVATTTLAK